MLFCHLFLFSYASALSLFSTTTHCESVEMTAHARLMLSTSANCDGPSLCSGNAYTMTATYLCPPPSASVATMNVVQIQVRLFSFHSSLYKIRARCVYNANRLPRVGTEISALLTKRFQSDLFTGCRQGPPFPPQLVSTTDFQDFTCLPRCMKPIDSSSLFSYSSKVSFDRMFCLTSSSTTKDYLFL
jgi:hypothetical protein